MNPLPLNARDKVFRHVNAVFGAGVAEQALSHISVASFESSSSSYVNGGLNFEYSRKTGRIKNFSIDGTLIGTLRTDGGIALSLKGAEFFTRHSKNFHDKNCVLPVDEAIPFVSEGRSLFCRHVKWCGPNVKPASDVAIIQGAGDGQHHVIAVGIAVIGSDLMVGKFSKGVAVKVREGLRSRKTLDANNSVDASSPVAASYENH